MKKPFVVGQKVRMNPKFKNLGEKSQITKRPLSTRYVMEVVFMQYVGKEFCESGWIVSAEGKSQSMYGYDSHWFISI